MIRQVILCSPRRSLAVLFSFLLLLALVPKPASAGNVAELAKKSGIQGGLIVHVGCADGKETAKLLLDDRYLVQGLTANTEQVQQARANVQATGHYGKVSIHHFDGRHLPYTNDLVNLLISSNGKTVANKEILRVLAPGGVAYARTAADSSDLSGTEALTRQLGKLGAMDIRQDNGWLHFKKAWPEEIDDWTHFLHGPDNNAVAQDSRVAIPRSIQWVSEPRWARTHEGLASLSAAVCAKGRIYYVIDEAPLASIRFAGNWKLVARDAFNGTLLWKQPITSWVDPLRHFRTGPAHLPRRLVAAGDRLYVTRGLAAPVVAVDGATGRQVMEYKDTQRTEEILFDQGVLYLVVGTSEVNRRGEGLFERGEPAPARYRYVLAIDAQSGKQLWKKDCTSEFILPLTLAVKETRVYYQSTEGVVCLNAKSGDELWRTPHVTPKRRMAFSAPTLVATDNVLLCADRDLGKSAEAGPARGEIEWGVNGWNEPGFPRAGKSTLCAYSTRDGSLLWSTPCSEGYNSPVDLFVVGNTVWVGKTFKGLDIKTGKLVKQLDMKAPRVGMPHHRCYRDKASERFIFTGKSGIEVFSLDKAKWLSNNSWIRGTCAFGIIPANGFLYAPPDACACFLTVKSPGFFAAAPRREATVGMPQPAQPVLVQGPRYGQTIPDTGARKQSPDQTDWPMYRHDPARSGATASPLPTAPKQVWTAELGGRLTQPVIVGGTAFVAAIDSHSVNALDAGDGHTLWQFTAGGRIDSAPTVYHGRVYFGAADGWVYSLDARDGTLFWRFRAAPAERLVDAYGQIESTWPTHGTVLIQNDTLYVTAGRSTFLDGGIVLYTLDPITGKQQSRTVICDLDPKTGDQLVPESRFNMKGTTSDVLVGDGDLVFLKYFTFDRSGHQTQTTAPHLFSITGFLGEEWFVRSYWVVGQGMPDAGWSGWANAAHWFPAGRILSFDKNLVYGYGRQEVFGGPVGHKADAYQLFCSGRTSHVKQAPPVVSRRGRKAKKKRARPVKPELKWSNANELIVRAMVLGSNRLAIAGPRDLGKKAANMLAYQNPAEALAAFTGNKGAFLRLASTSDGQTQFETQLPTLPVFDGMAAAGGRLFLSLKNGSVVCYGEHKPAE